MLSQPPPVGVSFGRCATSEGGSRVGVVRLRVARGSGRGLKVACPHGPRYKRSNAVVRLLLTNESRAGRSCSTSLLLDCTACRKAEMHGHSRHYNCVKLSVAHVVLGLACKSTERSRREADVPEVSKKRSNPLSRSSEKVPCIFPDTRRRAGFRRHSHAVGDSTMRLNLYPRTRTRTIDRSTQGLHRTPDEWTPRRVPLF